MKTLCLYAAKSCTCLTGKVFGWAGGWGRRAGAWQSPFGGACGQKQGQGSPGSERQGGGQLWEYVWDVACRHLDNWHWVRHFFIFSILQPDIVTFRINFHLNRIFTYWHQCKWDWLKWKLGIKGQLLHFQQGSWWIAIQAVRSKE